MQADASSIGFSTSAYGPFRTCHDFQVESAFRSEAEVGALSLPGGSFWRREGVPNISSSNRTKYSPSRECWAPRRIRPRENTSTARIFRICSSPRARALQRSQGVLYLDGIKVHNSPTDYRAVHNLQLSRFDGKRWVAMGAMTDLDDPAI